jgi:hypothetical protein
MPLQSVETQSYIRRTRIFVDSDDKNPDFLPHDKYNAYDMEIELDTEYERVVSIELVDYNVRRDITKTFHTSAANGGSPGNNWLDVHMTNDDNAEELDFSIDMGDRNYVLAQDVADDLEALLNTTMDAQGSAYYSTTAGTPVTWTVFPAGLDPFGFVTINSLDNSVTLVNMDITVDRAGSNVYGQFLFKTGPHANEDMHQFLGYSDADTIIPSETFTFLGTEQPSVQSPYFNGNLQSFQYVDVFVDEVPELQPVARINIAKTQEEDNLVKRDSAFGVDAFPDFTQILGVGNTTEHDFQTQHRLLVDPIRKLTKLHIRLLMPDGSRPIEMHQGGIDLVFDIYTISPEMDIPPWVKQRETY